MKKIRWGIIGPGSIAQSFADGLKETVNADLVAIASKDPLRLKAFGERHGISPEKRHNSYSAIVSDKDIDAIYISTPHPWHAEHALLAMRHGKAVLCEKPAGMSAAEVTAMTEVAGQQNVLFMEAFMYRSHPQIARMLEIIRSGELGDIQHVRTSFGFNMPYTEGHRLYDLALGGGGILDVGCYPVSAARLIAGAAEGLPFANPVSVKGTGKLAISGVDAEAYGLLKFASGLTAEIATAIARNLDNAIEVFGSKGALRMAYPWRSDWSPDPHSTPLEVTVGKTTRTEKVSSPKHLYAYEIELASTMIASGNVEAPSPAMSHADSVGNAETLDRWLLEVGYTTCINKPCFNRKLTGTIPENLPPIPKKRIDGVRLLVSQLIIGCDNRNSVGDGAIVWDAWMEAGGNTFDTAFVYGGGHHETVVGEWIKARGVGKDINVIVKGAHSPYCTPRAMAAQLDMSLSRLGLNHAPIYVMHRDNPQVPVGEFVDALNALHLAGRIGIFGGSNWSTERIAQANAYAKKHQLKPMSVLNNNLSLAVMEKPVWDGCITSNTPATLKYLRDNRVAHFSWSSQARGYFLPENLRNRLPADTAPETCFGSNANAERRNRAETLAKKYGVSAHNIATAWVLAQSFPSFALVGPRSPGEIASTLPGLAVNLSTQEVMWLNLESDQPL